MTATTATTQAPRGKYFEDFEIGQTFRTPRRTITSTDIVNFACLTGDFNEVHTNFEYCAANTATGQPIAHGPLVYAVAAGLQYASGVNDGTLLALLQIDGWRMIAAVSHGDTIQMITEILEKKESSKPDRGVVTLKRTIVNQRGESVQEMTAKLLYRRRPR